MTVDLKPGDTCDRCRKVLGDLEYIWIYPQYDKMPQYELCEECHDLLARHIMTWLLCGEFIQNRSF